MVYIPGDMAREYNRLSPATRSEVNAKVDELYSRQMGMTRRLDPTNPANWAQIREWLRIRDQVMAERLGRSPITTPKTPKDRLKELVDQFAKRTGPTAFAGISRMNVASDLRKRIDNPLIISQGPAGLCAPASLLAATAAARPEDYVTYIIDLYEHGRAKIGRWTITPGTDLRKYVPQPAHGLSEADWIGMASIRDSENFIFDYERVSDHGGTSLAELEKWAKKMGFTQVVRKDLSPGDSQKTRAENLREAVGLHTTGYKAILAIDANLLQGVVATPHVDHAVLLTSPVRTAVAPGGMEAVSFSVFSWGQGHCAIPPGPPGTLLLNSVLDRYGGFVAVRF